MSFNNFEKSEIFLEQERSEGNLQNFLPSKIFLWILNFCHLD